MSKTKAVLKIFCLSSPHLTCEWSSLLGDKFLHALSFEVKFVSNLDLADVVVWDGVIGHKFERIYTELLEVMKDKILFLTGDTSTLYKNSDLVRYTDSRLVPVVELWGGSVLPENILAGLETCFRKKFNV